MPQNARQPNTYEAKKNECKDIISDIIKEMRILPNNDGGTNATDKTLIRSSREALKAVFKDPNLGQDAFNYLSELKSEEGKSDEQIQNDKQEFKDRVSETNDLLAKNTRKTNTKDMLDSRVVGKKRARINQGGLLSLAVTVPAVTGGTSGLAFPAIAAIASTGIVSNGITTIIAIAGANLVAGAYSVSAGVAGTLNSRNDNKENTVTKIHPNKKVNANSEGVSENYKDIFQGYENLELDYKDLLFEKMTGKKSESYKKTIKTIDVVSDVMIGQAKGLTMAEAVADTKEMLNNSGNNYEPSNIAGIIKSFMVQTPNRNHAQNIEQERVSETNTQQR